MPSAVTATIFWIAATCCFVAQIAVIRSAVRSPMTGSPDAPVAMPRRSFEIAWTLVPAIALALLLLFTWRAMHPPAMPGMDMPAGHRMIEQ